MSFPDNEDDLIEIAGERVTPDEILKIQEWLSTAARVVAGFLRVKYDDSQSSGRDVVEGVGDGVIRTAVKFVAGWLAEGGSGGGEEQEESLGLLEVLVSLCSTKDVEIITWAMRGIKGIILYTESGGDELLTNKDQLWGLLDLVIEYLSNPTATEEVMIMVQEVCNVFRIMVDSQPLMISEKPIQSFPEKAYASFTPEKGEQVRWEVQTKVSLLALEILLRMSESGVIDRQLRDSMRKWSVRVRELIRTEEHGDTKDDLMYLASALENLSI